MNNQPPKPLVPVVMDEPAQLKVKEEMQSLGNTLKKTAPNIVEDIMEEAEKLAGAGKKVTFITLFRAAFKKVFSPGGALERTGQQHPELLNPANPQNQLTDGTHTDWWNHPGGG